jgi:hypothetical protein
LVGPIPKVVTDLVAIIEKHGLQVEGLFRVSAQVSQLLTLKEVYENSIY